MTTMTMKTTSQAHDDDDANIGDDDGNEKHFYHARGHNCDSVHDNSVNDDNHEDDNDVNDYKFSSVSQFSPFPAHPRPSDPKAVA